MINGKNRPLNNSGLGLPNVGGALRGWFQKLTATRYVKSIENYQSVFTPTVVQFEGVIQPFSAQQIALKPEGQRAWKWYTIHATPELQLTTDEKVTIRGVTYRIQGKWNWAEYGYLEYHGVEDFEDAP